MERVGLVWRARPGKAEEYDRRHAEVWPELGELLREAGVHTYAIYRWGDILFGHLEVADFGQLVERYRDDPVAERWEAEFAELIECPNADPETGWPERLGEVWSMTSGEPERL